MMDNTPEVGHLDEDGYTQLDFSSRRIIKPVVSEKGVCASLPWRCIAAILGILCLVILVIAVVLGTTAPWRSNSGSQSSENGQLPPRNKENHHQPTQSSLEESVAPNKILTTTGIITSSCPSPWITHRNSCYLFSTSLTSWNKSRNQCSLLDSHLLKIDSAEELEFILKQVSSQPDHSFWIGLSRHHHEGPWLWEDGAVFFPYLFQVTSTETQEKLAHNCVWIHVSIFYDQLCNVSSYSICEKQLSK